MDHYTGFHQCDCHHGKLRQHDWNVSETARTLDMPRSNLYKKIERYGLTREH